MPSDRMVLNFFKKGASYHAYDWGHRVVLFLVMGTSILDEESVKQVMLLLW